MPALKLLRILLQWRFALLCLAALEAPLQLPLGGTLYSTKITFVANDWQAALISVYLAGKFRPYGTYLEARSIVAIHNLRHQVFTPELNLIQPSAPAEDIDSQQIQVCSSL